MGVLRKKEKKKTKREEKKLFISKEMRLIGKSHLRVVVYILK